MCFGCNASECPLCSLPLPPLAALCPPLHWVAAYVATAILLPVSARNPLRLLILAVPSFLPPLLSGDVLLTGENEFTLNTDWLSYLNLRFPTCNSKDDFTPAPYAFSRPEHKPLAFLFEFFQMIPRLKLIPGKRYVGTDARLHRCHVLLRCCVAASFVATAGRADRADVTPPPSTPHQKCTAPNPATAPCNKVPRGARRCL